MVCNHQGKRICYKINRRPSQSKQVSPCAQAQIKRREREKSSVRAKVEHLFAVVKHQLRYRKTLYRGLRKQIAKLNIMFTLANLTPSAIIARSNRSTHSNLLAGRSFFTHCAVLP